ncbi:OmpA family outer membrane protein [Pseudomonas sp. M47T1]|uniref:OmpA family protein n=1 Tax=unclassified Pseudomonas TaxID=196821 RepID=UPI0002606FEA|nr:OmpA family protein [Pseudomonas sp. M47T1]EIK94741.1 OmpA family outer membrane protein [Pseudomonas sp. M47T1]
MYSNKSIAFALCLAVTGCAQTPQNNTADNGGFHWWPFGATDHAVDKDVAGAITDKVAKDEVKPAPVGAPPSVAAAAVPATAPADSGTHWWWPFPPSAATPAAAKPAVAVVPKIDAKMTQAWLDSYEPKVREAVKGSSFQVERRADVLVVIAPVDSSFNPKRPELLLPITLSPITNIAKAVETDPKTAVLIVGHADASGAPDVQKISLQRAQSISAIFHLSGLDRQHLAARGMGSLMPRAANDSVQGRALNRRIEIVLTPQETMVALVAKYSSPTPPVAEMVAVQDVKPVPAATPAKKAAGKKTAAKKAPAKPAAKKKVTPAKAAAPAKKKPDAVAQVQN